MTERTCFYCGALVSAGAGQDDHFPLPERHGGTQTVFCCTTCHDMKDRFSIDGWPNDWIDAAVKDMAGMSRHGKIALAKMIALACDAGAQIGIRFIEVKP